MDKKILVIDDDPAVRGAFELVLNDAGYQVTSAENGLLGIEMAQANRPDIIFLDLKMPGIDGVETLRRLKAFDPTLIIYIVTAFSNEFMDQLAAVHEEGLQFQLASKPLSSSQIRQLASSAINRIPTANQHKLMLTLYVVTINNEIRQLIEQINQVLSATYEPDCWALNVIEVLKMPEKALENEVFATPMLMRDLPKPVIRLMGDLSRVSSVLAAMTSQHVEGKETIVI